MTCREFIDFLLDYHSGALPAGERACFEEHLAACPACLAYLDMYEQTIRLGKAACCDPEAPLPADVPDDLVRAILAARGASRGGPPT